MATSFINYVGDGTITDFNVTFGYLDQTHVGVTVDSVAVTFTWFSATVVRLDAAPAASSAVQVKRETTKTPIVDFEDGAVLFESDLDTSALQAIYIAEEAFDNTGGDTSADAAAASASASAAAVSAAAAAASAIAAATFDPADFHTEVVQDGTDAAQDALIALKAPLASPTFTGTPLAATAAPGTNTTQLATTAFVTAAIAAIAASGWALVETTYDFGVDGVLASVETTTFADGYEYMLTFEALSHNSGGNARGKLEFYKATDAAYDALGRTGTSSHAASVAADGMIRLPDVRDSIEVHAFDGSFTDAGAAEGIPFSGAWAMTAQKIDKARISFSAGSIDGGKVRLYRKAI